MEAIRYGFAVFFLMVIPAVLVFWCIVHPFIGFWRKIGIKWTYSILLLILASMGWGMYCISDTLLAYTFPFNGWLCFIGIVMMGISIYISYHIKKSVSVSMLAGFPEVAPQQYKCKLITDGIYGRIRHPRYVEGTLTLVAWSLILNYPAIYALMGIFIVLMPIMVWLEERELLQRFRDEYREYSKKVPRFVPRLKNTESVK